MSKPIKYVLLSLIAVAVVGASVGFFLYNKPHTDLREQEAAFSLTATELFKQYESDEAGSDTRYLNQLIQVRGKVGQKRQTDDGGVVLLLEAEDSMFGVNCAFLPEESASLEAVEAGQTVTLRGLCAGILMDVSLTRCVLI